MSNNLPLVRQALTSIRWAIDERKLTEIVAVLEARIENGERFTPEQMAARAFDKPKLHAAARPSANGKGGAVAVLPLTGLIMPKASMVNGPSTPPGTSCEQFGQMFDAAMADPGISAIVIDVDSPGGSVAGVPELASRMLAARGKKPVTAVANGQAASAAYWIASMADEIVVTPSGEVGSIGVFCVHADASEYFAKQGIKHTIIKAGEFKAEGNPYDSLSADALGAIQGDIDTFYGMFVNAVAKGRNVGAPTVEKNFGQGRCVLAKMAVASGMADRIGTLESVLKKLGVTPDAYASAKRADDFDLPIAAGVIGSAADVILSSNFANNITAVAGVAAPVVLTLHENQPAPNGQEFTMPELATAPANGAAPDVATALAAERLRAKEITALCNEHGVNDANVAASMIERGISVNAAASEILALKKAESGKAPVIRGGHDRATDKPFASLGQQLMAVIKAGRTGAVDPRLFLGAASGLNESVGSEGGFLIAPEFMPGLTKVVFDNDPILSRVKRIPSTNPIVKYNVLDETSRATGSRAGGVQMYWAAEAGTAAATKPRFRQMVLEKKKLLGFCYLTDELTQDASAAQAIVTDAFTSELQFMAADAVFRGSGVGQPLGFLNSGAVASVAIEAAQTIANTAASIAINTSKMLARIPASLWGDVIFLYNQELLPKLAVATVGGSSGAVPVFMGAGGMSGKVYDTIWGRPAFASELCEAEGTVGDIIAIAPSQYAVLGGDDAQVAESIHVRFLNDENTLRFTTRMDGALEWKSTITRYKGGSALSPVVTLATRA